MVALRRIVASKKAMGLPSSFSYEFVRLAGNGLKRGLLGAALPGADLDKKAMVPDVAPPIAVP